MMIPILKDYYGRGYLPAGSDTSLPAYVPNVNMALRRSVIEQIGGYDVQCSAGEDADLSVRAARAGWALYYEPRARVHHEARADLSGLLRQWRWYGHGGSHFFAKRRRHRLEVHLNVDLPPQMHGYRRVLATRWWPVPSVFYVSYFTIAHLLLALAAVLLITGLAWPALAAVVALGLMILLMWRRSRLRRLTWRELALYARVTYLVNWTCIVHSLRGGATHGMMFIYPGL